MLSSFSAFLNASLLSCALFCAFTLPFTRSTFAAEVSSNGLKDFIEERKSAVGNKPYREGMTLQELNRTQRVNLGQRLAQTLRERAKIGLDPKSEEARIRELIRVRFPDYFQNPEILIADVRALLNEAVTATQLLQSDWKILQKISKGSRLIPAYLGPDVILRILNSEILDHITVDTLRNQIFHPDRLKLFMVLETKFSAIEKAWVTPDGVLKGPASARTQPELLKKYSSFFSENKAQFDDWLNYWDFDEQIERMHARLDFIRPQSVGFGEIMEPAHPREQNILKKITATGGVVEKTLQEKPSKYPALSLLQETLYSLVPQEERLNRGREIQSELHRILERIHIEFWFDESMEEGEPLLIRNQALYDAFEKSEGKKLRVPGASDFIYMKPGDFSAAYEDWLFLQADRMIRNHKEFRNQHFGKYKIDWKRYTRALYEKLEKDKLPELISGVEMNKGFLSLVDQYGLSSTNLGADLQFFSELDLLRMIRDTDDYWELFFGMRRDGKLLKNEDIAKILRFIYDDADPVTRFQYNRSLYDLLVERAETTPYAQGVQKNSSKNILAFTERLGSDLEFRENVFEQFVDKLHALPREDRKSVALLKELQSTMAAFFLEGATMYHWESALNPKSVCIRGTH